MDRDASSLKDPVPVAGVVDVDWHVGQDIKVAQEFVAADAAAGDPDQGSFQVPVLQSPACPPRCSVVRE